MFKYKTVRTTIIGDQKTTSTSIDFFSLPFSDGLTIDIFDAAGDILVVYE